jgi:mRNA-degrading endonuclease RelE of RelBE toxin-antitoxin system
LAEGFWKYRVRRYRVVYEIRRREHVIRVIAVGHRRRIYEDVASERSGR